jgi:hypothetical protein
MHNPASVGGGQGSGELVDDPARRGLGDALELAHAGAEGVALEVLHHQVGSAIFGLAGVGDLEQPGMGHYVDRSRLVEEAGLVRELPLLFPGSLRSDRSAGKYLGHVIDSGPRPLYGCWP